MDPVALQESYKAAGAKRWRNVAAPHKKYLQIFDLEVLVPYTGLYCAIWNEVAVQNAFPPVTEDAVKLRRRMDK